MRVIECLGLAKADYIDADRLQRELHGQAIAGGGDAIIVSEMQPVWIAGRHTRPEHIPDTSIRVIHVDRAGSAAWYGLGQLMRYPVVKLKEPVDLYAWIRAVEAGMIATIREEWQLPVHRVEGRAGAWLTEEGRADRGICTIGLKVARGTALHGITLNVDIDPASVFSGIIPCGLSDADVTSLSWEGIHTDMRSAAHLFLPHLFAYIRPLLARPDRELEGWIVR